MELVNKGALLVFFGIMIFIRSMIDIPQIYHFMSWGGDRNKPAAVLTIVLFTLLLAGTIALWNKKKLSIYFLSIYSTFYSVIFAGVFLYHFKLIKIDETYQALFYPVYSFITGFILSSLFLIVLWALFKIGKSSEFNINENYLVGTVMFSLITAIALVFTF